MYPADHTQQAMDAWKHQAEEIEKAQQFTAAGRPRDAAMARVRAASFGEIARAEESAAAALMVDIQTTAPEIHVTCAITATPGVQLHIDLDPDPVIRYNPEAEAQLIYDALWRHLPIDTLAVLMGLITKKGA